MKKFIDIVTDVLTVIILLVSILIVSMSLTSRSTGIANLAGYTMFSVQTESMEPTINAGDLMISKIGNENSGYVVGDVVTFKMVVDRNVILNSHRIVDTEQIDGVTYYITQGDNVDSQDNSKLVAGDIVATWTGIRIPGAGKVLDTLRTQQGFFVFVLLPMIVFFLYQLYRFVVNLIEYNKEKAEMAASEKVIELTEEQKKKAIEEYLASQKKQDE